VDGTRKERGLQQLVKRWAIRLLRDFRRETSLLRVRVTDHRLEEVVSLKDFRQTGWAGATWIGLAPDDSPLMLHDIGTQEIYALDWQVP
jgi:hypothetical protein